MAISVIRRGHGDVFLHSRLNNRHHNHGHSGGIPWLPEPELLIAGNVAPPYASEAAVVSNHGFTG